MNIPEVLGKVSEWSGRGLSLTAAAAQTGVLRRPVVSWVRLADEGVEPFRSWLVGVVAADAAKRQAQIARIQEVADRTTRRGHWASRDLERLRGAPTELERELRDLRKEGRGRQARLDARKLQRELG